MRSNDGNTMKAVGIGFRIAGLVCWFAGLAFLATGDFEGGVVCLLAAIYVESVWN